MKFNVSSRELFRVLKATGSVILKKNSLPILGDHLFESHDGKFTITGSSAENTLTMPVGITIEAGDIFAPFCLDASQVLGLLGALPEQPLTIDINMEKLLATICYQSGQVTVPVESAAEYPKVAQLTTPLAQFTIASNIFFPAVSAAVKCSAHDELRPQMNTVCLDVQDDGVVFVASDGHTLYKYVFVHGVPFLTAGGKDRILIPNTIVQALPVPFVGFDEITLTHDGKHLSLTAGEIVFTIRDSEGNYPNYNSVIPKNQPYHAILPTSALQSAVKRVQLMANDASYMVKLAKEGMFLTLSVTDYDFSRSAHEQLTLADVESPCTLPDGFAIGFKSTSLLTLLDAVGTDNVRIELAEPSRAILIKEDAPNSTLTELLKPMALE